LINAGIPPIHEHGLSELLEKHAGIGLRATVDYNDAIPDSDLTFICVGTPSDEDGRIDLSIVRSASESIGDALELDGRDSHHVVVVKSTVVPGTTEDVIAPLIHSRGERENVGIAMNHEFLRVGKAVYDFMNPDKIVIGGDPSSAEMVARLYEKIPARQRLQISEHQR